MIWCRCWEYGWGREGIKPGTEWNRTKVIDVQYECGGRIWEGNGVNILADQCTESSSRVLYQPRRREKHTADSIEPHQAYETLQPSTWYLCLVSQTLCLQARGWQCHYCLWAQPWEVEGSTEERDRRCGNEWWHHFLSRNDNDIISHYLEMNCQSLYTYTNCCSN